MANHLTYPCNIMNITQSYNGNYSHQTHRGSNKNDFPIDEACADSGRSWFICPCDEMIVKRVYGVSGGGTNTIWLQSAEKVQMPCGSDYVTIMIIHPEDDDLKKLTTGMIFKRGQQMFREGRDGRATGNHFHMSVSKGQFSGNGWAKNAKGAWVITGNPIKPEQAFYISDNTKISNAGGLKFVKIPAQKSQRYCIWVGYFTHEADAKNASAKIKNELNCYSAVRFDAAKSGFYVSVEHFTSKDRAIAIKAAIDKKYKWYCEVRSV